jgi:lipid II:glycine glycyltransferase (peptidoglycan interpeptide bridge formation enzyme)
MLLRVRARDAEGNRIATGLFLGMNEASFYWGGASWRKYQKLHPNELVQWYAMRYWKRRGMKTYNLVGTMDFKQRFGGKQTSVPMISKSKYRVISQLRSTAPKIGKAALQLAWKLKGRAKPKPAG